jgi:F-type H+-transporting ATPase subunit b
MQHVHLCKRILGLVFLSTLLAGVAIAPLRIAAQEPGSAVQSHPSEPSQVSGQAAAPEAAKSEAVDENKFRHTPLVQAAAKALNLSTETMARIFEFINFAIIALAIVLPLARFLPKFLRTRALKVRDDIESARKVTEDANARLSAVEAKLASLGDEIARFRTEVEQESLQDEAQIKAALKEESARIVAAAEQEIGVAAAQARRALRHFAADLAVGQAARQMVLTPETDRALIAEFVAGIAHGDGKTGGQN